MRVVIVGGVAGGASAAARLRRLDEHAEIVVYERGEHVSFANCGLPYHVGGVIRDRDALLLQTPEALRARFNLDVRVRHEVVSVDRAQKRLVVRKVETGELFTDRYDHLILAPGASPFVPPIPGARLPRVLTLRNIPDMDRILRAVDDGARRAVVIGGGYVGVELAENLAERGLQVSLVELAPQLLLFLEPELAALAKLELERHGVVLHLGDKLTEVRAAEEPRAGDATGGGLVARLGSGAELPADLVILAIGVVPETGLARDAGLALGPTGAIAVDAQLRTSDPAIFAVGDAVEVTHLVTHQKAKIPLAGPANRQGRIVANTIAGLESSYADTQGTSIIKVFGQAFAATGANSSALRAAKIPYKKAIVHAESHAGYYPGASTVHLEVLYSPVDGKLLGAQAAGRDGVDKRIDVLATALRHGATVYELEDYELAYAPPYGSAKDPVNLAGFVAVNDLRGISPLVTVEQLDELRAGGAVILDVRTPDEVHRGSIPGAVNIPLDGLRGRLAELPRGRPIVVYCAVGKRAHVAVRLLRQEGWQASNLTGGYQTYAAQTT